MPLIRYAGALTGTPLVNHTCHPHCGIMTLLFVDQDRRAVPITRFLDLYGFLKEIDGLAGRTQQARFKALSKVRALQALHRFFRSDRAPEGLTFFRFLQTLDGFADKKYSWDDQYRGYTYKTFYLAGMHFMDAYNYDLERVSRCGVHYSAPDGKIYPFCSYNSGPTFRKRVERGVGWRVTRDPGLGRHGSSDRRRRGPPVWSSVPWGTATVAGTPLEGKERLGPSSGSRRSSDRRKPFAPRLCRGSGTRSSRPRWSARAPCSSRDPTGFGGRWRHRIGPSW